MMASFTPNKRVVIVLGKTGGGKSTVANRVLGSETFVVKDTPQSVTRSCTNSISTMKGTGIEVEMIDTVGLFDHDISNEDTIKEIKDYLKNVYLKIKMVSFSCDGLWSVSYFKYRSTSKIVSN